MILTLLVALLAFVWWVAVATFAVLIPLLLIKLFVMYLGSTVIWIVTMCVLVVGLVAFKLGDAK